MGKITEFAAFVILLGLLGFAIYQERQGTADIVKQRQQIEQLIEIIERCGAELAVDQDGNYDAIMPLNKEEVQALWDAMVADIERREKEQPPKSNAKPSNICPKCGVHEIRHEDIGMCPNCEAGNPRFTG